MQKVLIIGQAPPATKQEYPYGSTMLYDWLNEVGITKKQAQDIFEFDAVYNKFPGWNVGESHTGGHRKPTQEQMNEYWPVLLKKILESKRIIILGNVAKDFLQSKDFFKGDDFATLYLMHPSRLNGDRYRQNKKKIIKQLEEFLNPILHGH